MLSYLCCQKSSSFMNPREVMEQVCFLLEGESALRLVPSASHCLLSKCKWGGRGTLHTLLAAFFPHFPGHVSMDLGALHAGHGGEPQPGRDTLASHSAGCRVGPGLGNGPAFSRASSCSGPARRKGVAPQTPTNWCEGPFLMGPLPDI